MVAVRASRAAIPHMLQAGSGAIVNVASDLARQPDPRFVDYAAAKAALLSLSKSLSVEFGPAIRVNAVSPGPTRTPGFVQHFFDHVGPATGVNGRRPSGATSTRSARCRPGASAPPRRSRPPWSSPPPALPGR